MHATLGYTMSVSRSGICQVRELTRHPAWARRGVIAAVSFFRRHSCWQAFAATRQPSAQVLVPQPPCIQAAPASGKHAL